jgi:predicted RNA-binding protein with PIN domain
VTEVERDDAAPGGAPEIPDELLRGGIELAFAVAVAGARLRPPLPVPPSLKRYLKFQKLPSAALPVVRHAIEADDEFRQRVGAVATDDLAGRAGALWLSRPDGWEGELATLAAAADAEEVSFEHARDERSAVRQRDAATHTAARARAELAAARSELAREQHKRTAAEQRANDLVREREALHRELEGERARATTAREKLEAARSASEQMSGKLREARARVADLEARLEGALAARVLAEERAANAPSRGPAAAVGGAAGVDPATLGKAAGALGEAAAAIRNLASALDTTAQHLRPAFDGDERFVAPSAPAPARAADAKRARRAPLSIPGGLYGDSVEVADHLLRQRDVLVVVDGYNVAKLGWASCSLAEQRDALLDSLESLVRRVGTRVVVVFDGAQVVAPATGRKLLRVVFTREGVLADDEIRRIVAELPTDQPVVVVTNDKAILADVRGDGANTVSSDHLLAVLRR